MNVSSLLIMTTTITTDSFDKKSIQCDKCKNIINGNHVGGSGDVLDEDIIPCPSCQKISCSKCMIEYDDLFINTVDVGDAPYWYNSGEVSLQCYQCNKQLCAVCHDQSRKNGKHYCVECFDRMILNSCKDGSKYM